jgi:SAM-dependent methyltransferase
MGQHFICPACLPDRAPMKKSPIKKPTPACHFFPTHMTTEEVPAELVLEEGIDRELENILNHPAPAYGEVEYWNSRYRSQRGEVFEWFQPWSTLRSYVAKHIPVHGSALVIGCGSSTMSAELLSSFSRVSSIDTSDEVINQMKEKYSRENGLEWATMDCTKLNFGNNTFEAVLDKGTLDTLLCYDNSEQLVERALKEIARVLKPGGVFVLVSYGIPKTRKKYFDKSTGLSLVDTVTVAKPGMSTSHYIYVGQPA